MYSFSNNNLTELSSTPLYHSPAFYYAYITKLLGFIPHRHEGKILGLSGSGDPKETYEIINKRTNIKNNKFNVDGYFGYHEIVWLKNKLSKYSNQDIAAGIQKVLEETVLTYIKKNVFKIKGNTIVLSGGVFANVKLNQLIKNLGFKKVFIFPHMGDGGLAYGAAYAMYLEKFPLRQTPSISTLYLGNEYTEEEILEVLKNSKLKYYKSKNIEAEVANFINSGKVVAVFNGKMEYGPKSLGNRSIFYKADDATVNTWLNKRLNRTEFMPFAPIILKEDANRFFIDYDEANLEATQWMTITCNVSKYCKQVAPAVVHVDNTARPQIVTKEINRFAYNVLKEYKKLRGYSIMVNTSFNMHEEPIVRSPNDAIKAFKQSKLDLLSIGPFLIEN